jgi:erythromycin esterase
MKHIICILVFALVLNNAISQTRNRKIHEDWVNENLIELSKLNFNRIDMLDSILNEKRIVGIGEPLHASKTINEVRISLSKYLIQNHSFHIVAAEMPYYAGLIVNDYVLNNKRSRTEIIQVLERHHFFNLCAEFIAFIDWIKDYNQNSNKKVQIFGFDIQMNLALLNDVTNLFAEIDKDFSNELGKARQLIDKAQGGWFARPVSEDKNYVLNVLDMAMTKLELHKEKIIDYDLTKQKINVIIYDLEWRNCSDEESFGVRAKYNSDVIKWLVNNDGENKAILLAHSGHLGKSHILEPKIRINEPDEYLILAEKEVKTGYWLNEYFGQHYYFIGLQFSEGTFMGFNPDNEYELESLTVSSPSENSFNGLLRKAKSNYFFIETNVVKNFSQEVQNYLSTFQNFYSIGAAYDYKYMKTIPSEYYDSVIFIEEIIESEMISNPG